MSSGIILDIDGSTEAIWLLALFPSSWVSGSYLKRYNQFEEM
jgi:hypothetical protein